MQYLVILSDMDGNVDWTHPTELEASSKEDARNAIMENCPADSIKQILTVEEYKAVLANKKFRNQIQREGAARLDSSNYASGKDFFANMLQYAEETVDAPSPEQIIAEQKASTEPTEMSNEQELQTEIPTEPVKASNTKYFIDNGIMYKTENGVLYKKCWETVSLVESVDEAGKPVLPEYRIINSKTGKQVKSDQYSVQRLVWKPLTNM